MTPPTTDGEIDKLLEPYTQNFIEITKNALLGKLESVPPPSGIPLKAAIQAEIQKQVVAARIEELKNTMKETETGDVSIWVYKWAKRRIAELTKENKDVTA
jgi:hypothetical protein